jgi:superfamily II DNA helicase RecQ
MRLVNGNHTDVPSIHRLNEIRHDKTFWSNIIVALTATATIQVAADIKRLLKIPDGNHIQTGFERENLRFQVV